MGLLDDIAPVISKAVDVVMSSVTLVRESQTYDPESGKETGKSVSYACRGIVVDYTIMERVAMRVADQSRRLLITRSTLAVDPKVGDTVRFGTKVYTVQRISIDPANAIWDLEVS